MEAPRLDYPCTREKRRRMEETPDEENKSSAGSSRIRAINMSQKRSEADIAPMWVADVLLSNRLIVFKIFDYLNVRNLGIAASVCRFWRDCAQQVKRDRQFVHVFGTVEPDQDEDFTRKQYGRDLTRNLRECYGVPKLVLIFTTDRIMERGSKYFDDFSGSKSECRANVEKLRAADKFVYSTAVPNHISTMLPPGCLLQMCSAWGIVTTDVDLGPIEYETREGFAAMYFTEFPNVRILPFCVKEPTLVTSHPCAHEILHSAGLGDLKDAKAVLAFSTGEPEQSSHASCLVAVLLKSYPKLAFAGGRVISHGVLQSPRSSSENTKSLRRLNEDPDVEVDLCGIVIEGDVRAASVILPESCVGPDAVKERLTAFESFPIVRGRTVGFMFSCSGRGAVHHGTPNIESSVFSRLYPGVPLLGMFGGGEFGVDSFSEAPRNSMHSYIHTYTTVIMLITFNPPWKEDDEPE